MTRTISGPRGGGEPKGGAVGPGGAAPFVLGHRPALDGLRGLAILLVLGVHAPVRWVEGGYFGVDLFFVLSGFLITALLLQEHGRGGSIRLGRFYLRRALRLLPALLGVLLGCWVYARAWGPPSELPAFYPDARSALLYYYNWHLLHRLKHGAVTCIYLHHFWSLAVEEQFYLVWPAALAALLWWRVRRRWVLALALLGVALPTGLRFALWAGPGSQVRLYNGTDTRADALAVGCLVALLVAWRAGPKSGVARLAMRAGAWASLALVLAYCLKHVAVATFILVHTGLDPLHYGFTLVALAGGQLLATLVWAPPRLLSRLLGARPLRWLGRVSYGTYLWNLPVMVLVARGFGLAHPRAQTVLVLGCSLAAGALSHYLLERPFLRLKGRLDVAGPGPVAAALPAGDQRPLAA